MKAHIIGLEIKIQLLKNLKTIEFKQDLFSLFYYLGRNKLFIYDTIVEF
jgi:hypothetical protein